MNKSNIHDIYISSTRAAATWGGVTILHVIIWVFTEVTWYNVTRNISSINTH